jgi:hypothetical protein
MTSIKPKLLYRDEFGNTVWERNLKKYHGTGKQMYAKNAQGRIVTEEDLIDLARKGGIEMRKLKRRIPY